MKPTTLNQWLLDRYNLIAGVYVAVFCIAIFFRPYTAPGHLLIIDSEAYMEIASYVVDGTFWEKFSAGDKALFWFWPFGYPAMMGFIAFVLQTDVFLAGRILNLVAYLAIVFSIQRIFKDKWGLYVFLVGSASFITLFTNTLTEAAFLAFAFISLTQLSKKRGKIGIVILGFVMMTITRYIGVFTVFFLGTHYLRTRKTKYLIATILIGVLIFGYVKMEWLFSSKLPTSVIEQPQVETITLLKQTSLAMFSHFSFFELDNWGGNMGKFLFLFGLTPMGIIAYNLINREGPLFVRPLNENTVLLLYFGISYLMTLLFVLFGLGWDHAGWGIQSRYTAPGMIFLVIGLINSLQMNEEELKKLKLILLITSSFVLLYTGFFQSLIDYIKGSDRLV